MKEGKRGDARVVVRESKVALRRSSKNLFS